jgi:predicted transcriptional regulator
LKELSCYDQQDMTTTDNISPKRPYPVNVRLDHELRERLTRIARKQDRSLSHLMYLIIRDWTAAYEKQEADEAAQVKGKRKSDSD